MTHTLPRRLEDEQGFTLIELLVVILIIGILAAIAIPTFLNQKSKANDAAAETTARTAATAIETYATTNNGSYAGVTPSILNSIVPTLLTSSTSQSYLSTASGTSNSYTVVGTQPVTGDSFSIVNTAGTATFSCTPTGKGDCSASGTW